MTSGFFNFEIFIFLSYHLFFFFINCFIGSASKNSLAINILGIFDNSSKFFNHLIFLFLSLVF